MGRERRINKSRNRTEVKREREQNLKHRSVMEKMGELPYYF